MVEAREMLKERSENLFVIPFDDRPGKLFDGLQHCRSSIFISQVSSEERLNLRTSRYQRWFTEFRDSLFAEIEYADLISELIHPDQYPKYANSAEEAVFGKLKQFSSQDVNNLRIRKDTQNYIFYQEATQYWIKATFGLPYYSKNGVVDAPAHGRYIYFSDEETALGICAVLNSNLFYAYFIAYGDCFHLSDKLATGFPVSSDFIRNEQLLKLSRMLMSDLKRNASRKTINTKDGDSISYDEFSARKSKHIIDQIDRFLAQYYGFTDEELDFIINYDIKYRMGLDSLEVTEDAAV